MSEIIVPPPPPPPVPPAPTDVATWSNWIAYQRLMDDRQRHQDWLAECAKVQARHDADLIAKQAHAAAQAATAVSMQNNVDAIKAQAEALREPQWNKQSLTLWFLARLPEITGLTDLARTDLAVKQAEALLARIPPA